MVNCLTTIKEYDVTNGVWLSNVNKLHFSSKMFGGVT